MPEPKQEFFSFPQLILADPKLQDPLVTKVQSIQNSIRAPLKASVATLFGDFKDGIQLQLNLAQRFLQQAEGIHSYSYWMDWIVDVTTPITNLTEVKLAMGSLDKAINDSFSGVYGSIDELYSHATESIANNPCHAAASRKFQEYTDDNIAFITSRMPAFKAIPSISKYVNRDYVTKNFTKFYNSAQQCLSKTSPKLCALDLVRFVVQLDLALMIIVHTPVLLLIPPVKICHTGSKIFRSELMSCIDAVLFIFHSRSHSILQKR